LNVIPRKQSIRMCTVGNWTVWTNSSSRHVQSSLIVKKLCSIVKELCSITTRDHTQVWSPVKNYWSLDGMCCHTHYTHLTLRRQTSTCFALFKTPYANKDKSFYEREIMKLTEMAEDYRSGNISLIDLCSLHK